MSASDRIGKYEIRSPIGSGGFATVYRANDSTLGREVALKVLHPALLTDQSFVQRFFQEARTVAKLHHRGIITIYEVDQADGRVFLATELATGGSMAERIAAAPVPWAEALDLLDQIAAALDYAHSQGVIHRDLKPANILLAGDGTPLLSDFGFARLISENSGSLSASGGILGTPAYIAPEVWDQNAATPAADLYALACIAYEMLAGEALFSGVTPVQALAAHIRGPRLTGRWPNGVPHGVDAVLQRALDKEPAGRYPSAAAFAQAMRKLTPPAQPGAAISNLVQRPTRAAEPRPAAQPAPAQPAATPSAGPAPPAQIIPAGTFWGAISLLIVGEVAALAAIALGSSPLGPWAGIIGGALWGGATAVALHWIIPGFAFIKQAALLAAWTVSLLISMVVGSVSGLVAWSLLFPLIAIVCTGLIIRWSLSSFAWWRILIVLAAWVGGGLIVGAILVGLFVLIISTLGQSEGSGSGLGWAFAGLSILGLVIAFVLPNAVMIDQIHRARRALRP